MFRKPLNRLSKKIYFNLKLHFGWTEKLFSCMWNPDVYCNFSKLQWSNSSYYISWQWKNVVKKTKITLTCQHDSLVLRVVSHYMKQPSWWEPFAHSSYFSCQNSAAIKIISVKNGRTFCCKITIQTLHSCEDFKNSPCPFWSDQGWHL